MSKSYTNKHPKRTKHRGGAGGKILAVLLGFLLGIVVTLGGIGGAGYYLLARVTINEATDTVSDLTKTEIDISNVLTDEYASKTVLGLIGSIQDVSAEFSDGKGSFNTLNKISPSVKKSVEKIVDSVAKYGLELNVNELMETPFKNLGDYFTDTLDTVEIGTLLDKFDVELTGNAILMTLCYGEEGVDYQINANGEVEMLGDAKPTTVGEFKNLDDVLNGLALHSLFSSNSFDVNDPLMGALAFGPKTHYEIQTVNGKDTVIMKEITFTVDGENFVDVDGNVYAVTNKTDGTFVATYTDGDKTTTYNVKLVEGVLCAYDTETDATLRYQKTTIGDLINGSNPVDLIAPVELGALMKLNGTSNKALLALAYGVEGEDFEIVGSGIQMKGSSQPRTVGDLMGDELNSLFDTLPIASLVEVDLDSELLLALAYGSKSHYDFTYDGAGKKTGVVMKDITFTEKGDKLVDVDGKEYTVSAGVEAGTYVATYTDGDKTTTYNVKSVDGKLCAYSVETGDVMKYSKTTLSSLQKDPASILNDIEIGSALGVTPESNKILITLAYGVEGVDYTIENGKINPLKKPMTIGDMQDADAMNDKINSLTLDALLEVDYNDAMICALAYGANAHYTFTYDGAGKKTGVVMNDITFTEQEGNFVDVDGNVYAVSAGVEAGTYVATYTDGDKTTYNVKSVDGKLYAYDVATGDILKYSKTTIGSLQNNPSAILNGIEIGSALNITPESNKILITLAYGAEGDGYRIEGDKIIPLKKPMTLGDMQDADVMNDKINSLTLDALLEVDYNDAMICAFAYGASTHYTFTYDNEGKKTGVVMNDITFTEQEGNFVDVDGNVYTVSAGAAAGTYVATYTDGDKTTTYNVKSVDGKLYAYDVATGETLRYQKTTVGDLQKDPQKLLDNITLCDVLNVTAASDSLLLSLAYGVEGTDFKLEDKDNDGKNDTVTMLGNSKPKTLKELKENPNILNDLQLSAVLNVTPQSDPIMIELAYGHEGIDFDYILDSEGKKIGFAMREGHSPRTIADLQDEDASFIKEIYLATALGVTPASDSIMIALAYGNEGEDFEYILDGEGNKIGFAMKDGHSPRTLADLQGDDSFLKEIRLAAILDVSPLNDGDDKMMVALAYGNAGQHYKVENGEIVWLEDPSSTSDPKATYTYRTIADLENPGLIQSMQLATALGVTPSSDAIMIALAYGNEGEDFEYILDGEGNKIGFAMKDGHTPRTLADLQGDDSFLKEIRLSAILGVSPLNDSDDALMIALAYGNEGQHYEIKTDAETGKEYIDWKAIPDSDPVKYYTYRTIEDLQGNPALIQEMYLATALGLTPASDSMMIALAYGNEGEDFEYVLDGEGNKIGFAMKDGHTPRTLKDLQSSTTIFDSIRLADVLNISPLNVDAQGNPTDDKMMLSLAYGNEGQHYKIEGGELVWLEDPSSTSTPKATYTYRTISDLKDGGDLINSVQLATVLSVTPASDKILTAIAYGKEGVDFTYVDVNGNGVRDAADRFDMKPGVTPRTVKDLQSSDASLIKSIELSAIMSPDYDDSFIMYIIYGGGEGAHYVFEYDTADPTKKVGVTMLEQRIAIRIVDDAPVVYDEYGALLSAKTPSNQEGYTLTDNGDSTYTYTYTTATKTTTYTAKASGRSEAITINLSADETAVASVYWLYDEADTLLYYTPATIGDMQDGTGFTSIIDNLTIKELVGDSDANLFKTVGDWRISDLKNQDRIMSLKMGEVIEIDESTATPILLAMKEWTLNDLSNQDKIMGLKMSDVIDIDEDSSTILLSMKEWTLNDLSNQDKIMGLKMGEVIEIDESTATPILLAMKDWTLNDLSNQEKINGLKISDIIQVGGADTPKFLQYIANPDGDPNTDDAWTLGDLNSGAFNDIALGNIIDIDESNTILKHLADTPINQLATKLDSLTITQIFQHQIFARVTSSGTLYVDSNNNNVVDAGEEITDTDLISKYDNGDYLTSPDGYLFVDRNGNGTAEDVVIDAVGICGEYVIGDHIWWYLLHNEDECSGHHAATSDKQCYHPYALKDFTSLIDNMSENVEKATLNQLKKDGLVEGLNDATLATPITKEVDVPFMGTQTIYNTDKTYLGELTVTELLAYVGAIIPYLSSGL